MNVRTAIQMSLDKAAVAENIYSGLRTPADSVMPSDMPFCKYDTRTPEYNFDEAVKLLEDNGWKDSNGDGVRDKNGTELSYTITYPATGVYDDVVLYYQQTMQELGIEVKTDPLDLMTFFDKVFSQVNYEMTAYMSYWFPYNPYTFVANMYPSTDYTATDGIYSTDPQVAKALASMSDNEAKELIKGLYTYDDNAKIQEIYTKALNSANESSVIIPLNYRNEYAVYNSDKIASYTFNSIPNHVDVAAIKLK
ncbi:extracellular solute-binding protein, family 5 Middle [Ruminococcus sp. YE71]|uniref:ABC transporter substrate-binding protein n=1 Tax=unclassified Ruminococcus TaxID=2608920 RepID=UPI0008918412|nr:MULTISPECIES: ABC transporter substrate-binding protein [unclassified Ruminococcus]SDA28137.1 extracellular solute-binding protein, family 5 Middle [Ruminococcus sp. YE78]SFW35260.1 extracellular solute-binding protein, family 5 Middle [Ruminococcus sp. YE71]